MPSHSLPRLTVQRSLMALSLHLLAARACADGPTCNSIGGGGGEVKAIDEASEAAWNPSLPAPEHPVLSATAERPKGGEGEGVEGSSHRAAGLHVHPRLLIFLFWIVLCWDGPGGNCLIVSFFCCILSEVCFFVGCVTKSQVLNGFPGFAF